MTDDADYNNFLKHFYSLAKKELLKQGKESLPVYLYKSILLVVVVAAERYACLLFGREQFLIHLNF